MLNNFKKNNSFLNAQGVVEYMLVFIFATILMYGISLKFDLKSLKSFAIYGIVDKSNPTKIVLPPMTE